MGRSLNLKSTFNFCGEFGSIDGLPSSKSSNSGRRVKMLIESFFSSEVYGNSEISARPGLHTYWHHNYVYLMCHFPIWYRILTVCPLSVRNKTGVGGSVLASNEKQWELVMGFHAFFFTVTVRSYTQNRPILITDISSAPSSAENVEQLWRMLSLSQAVHLPFVVTQDLENCGWFSLLPYVTMWQ